MHVKLTRGKRCEGDDDKKDAHQTVYVNMPVPAASLLDEHGAPRQNFPTNAVYTSKYTAVTFLPKTLFEQFRRVANLYFLGLTILQFFPKYTTMNPFVSALPLVVIVGLTIVKDGFEDWKRHQSDAEMNATEACCLRGSGWRNSNEPFFHRRQKSKKFLETRRKSGRISPSGPSLNGINRQHKLGSTDGTADNSIEKAEEGTHVDGKPAPPPGTLNWAGTPWSDIETGDLILLKNDTAIPADVLILATSEPEGLCYVETKNLDGETNLKIRQGVPYTSQYLDSEDLETLGNLRCIVTCEKPNNSLYTFTGTLAVLKDDSAKDSSPLLVPLSIMNVLLRGCYLRNTEWAVGLVLQTGASTKIRQNSGKTPMKRSNTEGKMNTQVLVNLGVLFLLCLTTCIVNPLWERSWSEKSPLWLDWTYIHFVGLAEAAFDAFWNSIIIYQNVVPLSLYITIEIVKTAQAYFIYEDMDMFYPPTHRCIPRSWAIADDLGQIDYVFSDKTGTLTRNIMEFKKFSVSGVVYGEGIGQVEQGDGGEMCVVDVDNNGKAAKPAFWDSLLGLHMSMPDTTQYAAIGELFTALAICHSVLVSKDDNGDPVYKASSPDEAALVDAARLAGYTFVGRDNTTMTVRLPDGSMKKYELMNVLEFNSTRKRMSVIVRTPEKQLWLICKGADSVIWPRLTDGQETVKAVTEKHLEYFAEEGLRTLSVAGTILAEEAYLKWMEAYQAATVALDNRESRTDAVTEEIERNMQLIGATAIEDKLQDGVPECIATLMSAGIKVWVLTGDKLETAINIGLSCNLLTRDMHLILVRGEDGDQGEGAVDAVTSQLEHALQNFFQQQHSRTATQPQFQKNLGADLEEGGHISGSQKLNVTDPKAQPGGTGNPPAAEGESYGLVIDGAALLSTLHNEKARTLLLKLATLCSSVICCRVSPLQKAQIVNLVKTNQKAMCLAIGDGANDVSMIQAAHIGIGIAGEEGLQAAMASDYAIAQFRFLSKLLLVHGRWSYRRTADMILCFFFKNIIWVMVLFWYQIYCGFSAQAIYDSTYTLLYNVVFTALPVITLGVFDQDILAKYALVVPPVYQSARQWTFSYWRFVGYMLDAFYQSLIIIFMVKGGMDSDASMWKSGRASDLMVMGTTAAITAVINANLVVVVNTNSFSWITWLAYSISEAIVVAWTLLYSFFPGSTLWGIIGELVSTASFWLTFALITVLCQLPKLAIKYGWRILWPTDTELVQEIQHMGLDDVFESETLPNRLQPKQESEMVEVDRASASQKVPPEGRSRQSSFKPYREERPPNYLENTLDSDMDFHAKLEMGGLHTGENSSIRSRDVRDLVDKQQDPSTIPTTLIEAIPCLEADLSRPTSATLRRGSQPPTTQVTIPPPLNLSRPSSGDMNTPASSRSGLHNSGGTPSPIATSLMDTRRVSTRYSIRSIPSLRDLATPVSVHTSMSRLGRSMVASRTDVNSPGILEVTSPGGGQVSMMRTGETLRNRGFSFSQDEGASKVLRSHCSLIGLPPIEAVEPPPPTSRPVRGFHRRQKSAGVPSVARVSEVGTPRLSLTERPGEECTKFGKSKSALGRLRTTPDHDSNSGDTQGPWSAL